MMSVLAEDGRITRIAGAGEIAAPDGARAIDCGGMTLMPGLTDAHVHFGLTATGENEPPESHVSYVLKVVENIRIALDEGFTTVRDAGGLDPAYALAVAERADRRSAHPALRFVPVADGRARRPAQPLERRRAAIDPGPGRAHARSATAPRRCAAPRARRSVAAPRR